jgi:PTS system N-acetylglucosamine-specific IIC component
MRDALSGQGAPTPPQAPAVQPSMADPASSATAVGMLAALGGAQNVTGVEAVANRLLVGLASAGGIDETALRALGVRAIARTGPQRLQLVLGEDAGPLGAALAPAA